MEFVDVYDLVDVTIDYGNYIECEREVITPALKAAGYSVGTWRTGEGDSFGPLSRCVTISKDGVNKVAVYG
jgi:ribonuclease HIII